MVLDGTNVSQGRRGVVGCTAVLFVLPGVIRASMQSVMTKCLAGEHFTHFIVR